jgi:hypothetical protein
MSPETTITADEIIDIAHGLLNADIFQYQYELPSGKMANRLAVTRESATLMSAEKFGQGNTPYGNGPAEHQKYLNSPDVASTEGSVTYHTEDGMLALPKMVYFEEEVEFEDPIKTDDPHVALERLAEELSVVFDQAVMVNTPLRLEKATPAETVMN